MGESERYIDRRVRKMTLGEDNNALIALITINAMWTYYSRFNKAYLHSCRFISATFSSHILPWFILPAKLTSLGKAPWTVLSYMFVHTTSFLLLRICSGCGHSDLFYRTWLAIKRLSRFIYMAVLPVQLFL